MGRPGRKEQRSEGDAINKIVTTVFDNIDTAFAIVFLVVGFVFVATAITGGWPKLQIVIAEPQRTYSLIAGTVFISISLIIYSITRLRVALRSQQNTINQLVIYSLSELIYRDILWAIRHNKEVKFDNSADQLRWLRLLFNHGLLTAKDWNKFQQEIGTFDNIPLGMNLSEIFEATPAANWLMKLRGRPH